MNIFKKNLQYLVGFFFFLLSLSLLGRGKKFTIGAIIFFMCSLVIIPFSRNIMERIFNFKFGKKIKYIISIIGFISPFFFVETDEVSVNKEINQSNVVLDSILIKKDSLINDSLKSIRKTQNKNILPVTNTNNDISKTKKLINNSKSKRKSNYSTSPKNRIVKKTTKKRNTSTYNSGSGYCGHPNKTGGYCRRRVRGGGYCWQHSQSKLIVIQDDLQAWSNDCENIRRKHNGWNEESEQYAQIKLICENCYFEIKNLNQ